MKKISYLLIILFFVVFGCTTAKITKDSFDADGKKVTTTTYEVKRPIGASASLGAVTKEGEAVNINAASSINVDQLISAGIAGYMKYLTGGLAPIPVQTIGPTVQNASPAAGPTVSSSISGN